MGGFFRAANTDKNRASAGEVCTLDTGSETGLNWANTCKKVADAVSATMREKRYLLNKTTSICKYVTTVVFFKNPANE